MLTQEVSSELRDVNGYVIYCPKFHDSLMIELLSNGMDQEMILEAFPYLAPKQRIECMGCFIQAQNIEVDKSYREV